MVVWSKLTATIQLINHAGNIYDVYLSNVYRSKKNETRPSSYKLIVYINSDHSLSSQHQRACGERALCMEKLKNVDMKYSFHIES